MTHTYKVTGMTCNSCVSKVQKPLSEINGVQNVNVLLNPPEANIAMDNHIGLDEMNSALKNIGNYKMEELTSVIVELCYDEVKKYFKK